MTDTHVSVTVVPLHMAETPTLKSYTDNGRPAVSIDFPAGDTTAVQVLLSAQAHDAPVAWLRKFGSQLFEAAADLEQRLESQAVKA